MKYLALFRGVNVGGKNKLSMSELKTLFESLGLQHVSTYINSGNAIFDSDKSTGELAKMIEAALLKNFTFDSELIKTLVLAQPELANVIASAPAGFGKHPETYHSDVIFLIDADAREAAEAFTLNPDVDKLWAGPGVVYFQRVSALRTKSRMRKIVGTLIYKNMTIRSWSTTTKLLDLLSTNA